MSEAKHTPEPWIVRHSYNVMDSAYRGCIAACGGRSNNMDGGATERENRANAARIVACVNALRGLDVAKVEALLDAIREECNPTIDDRDELARRATTRMDAYHALRDSVIRAGGGQC